MIELSLNELMISIADNLKNVRQTIKNASISVDRKENSVQLLAVSKTKPVEAVRKAIEAGQTRFGENYLQDAIEKIEALKDEADIEWHFIGPIQSNKTRSIALHFDWVQTLDREKIAQRLNDQRPKEMSPLSVCIQINIDDEDSKSGIKPEALMTFAEKISLLPKLKLRGIMTIPAKQTEQETRKSFQRMKALFQLLQAKYPQVDTLSIGMSSDISIAIEEGSTMVRVGTALFGAREPLNK
jgi:pyridoxal phosphate enzyme (YggS family)